MKIQICLLVALTAQLSTAFTLPWSKAKKLPWPKVQARLERRQNDGLTPSNAASLMGGSSTGTGLAGALSGYSIASMFVSTLNCKYFAQTHGLESG
jgi:hypothetical protein